jgi:hypothetical protein
MSAPGNRNGAEQLGWVPVHHWAWRNGRFQPQTVCADDRNHQTDHAKQLNYEQGGEHLVGLREVILERGDGDLDRLSVAVHRLPY